ncbi:hypothetical protein BDR03DRAFT_956619 [Suillus americanus]|nr:hypothetical protein BDR03DRAFT_956619 [Suillus americanus]
MTAPRTSAGKCQRGDTSRPLCKFSDCLILACLKTSCYSIFLILSIDGLQIKDLVQKHVQLLLTFGETALIFWLLHDRLINMIWGPTFTVRH